MKSVESVSRIDKLDAENYFQLKKKCIQSGTLFEDESFPANNSSFYCKECTGEIKWMRPHQLTNNPNFYLKSNISKKLNVIHGKLGNLWFLGALAALTLNKELFEHTVPINQAFDKDYVGMAYVRDLRDSFQLLILFRYVLFPVVVFWKVENDNR